MAIRNASQPRAVWPGSPEPVPATSVPIPRPIRVASAALEGREHLVANVSVVDDNDAFLAFGDDGAMLPTGLALPRGPIWLLVPGSGDELSYDGEPRVIADTALPPGWSQWSLTLVDLENVKSVTFGNGKPHGVRNFSAARIEVGQPLDGVRTSGGASVFTRVPEVILPVGLGGDADWEVSLLNNKADLMSAPPSAAASCEERGRRDPPRAPSTRPRLAPCEGSGHRTLCIGLGPGQREGGGCALAGAAGGSRIPP
jgi:hypothetical protein